MNQKKTISDIQALAKSIFENSIDQLEAEKRINEIHGHFKQITKISGQEMVIENMAAIPAAKGMALGLNHAAQCLLDYKRTVKFIKAIISAILEKQKEQQEKVINIFYAGCGPYATLLTLVAPYFKSEEVQFTLLEINKNSVVSAKKLITQLNLDDYVNDIFIADAVTFEVPNAKSFDILVSETLDALLYRECYVPILFNMLAQFNENTILIPENVVIELTFIPRNLDQAEHEFGRILDVRKSVAAYNTSPGYIPSQLKDKIIDLKPLDLKTYEKFILDTRVHVYGDIWLNRNESSLTLPLNYPLAKPFTNSAIIFTYELEPETKLNCSFE